MAITDLIHSWRLFRASNFTAEINIDRTTVGSGSSVPRHKPSSNSFDSSSLSRVVFNRIATDAAMIPITHTRIKDGKWDSESIKSNLQNCLSLEANIDQTSFQLFHTLWYSTMEEGVVALVPTESDNEPNDEGAFDVYSLRVGKITQWFPKHVEIELYNENNGNYQRIVMAKATVAIVENPFYEIVNSPNSTLNRLKRKMALLDRKDEEVSSGKFNMLIQLPYEIKGEARTQQANLRKAELNDQLKNSEYGVAYTGASEKVIQLNRPIDNDLAEQVKYLREEFYNQLGLTENIFNGTAGEAEMNNYFARSIEPLLTTGVLEIKRKFLTKTARTQGQDIIYNRDVFKLVSVSTLAEIADKFTRNEIFSANEFRGFMGVKASSDPKADELRNSNIAANNQTLGRDPELGPQGMNATSPTSLEIEQEE